MWRNNTTKNIGNKLEIDLQYLYKNCKTLQTEDTEMLILIKTLYATI